MRLGLCHRVIMASSQVPQPNTNQRFESVYFNWRCVLCLTLAKSPLQLEMQHLNSETIVYKDTDGVNWLKCEKCFNPYHLSCITNKTEAQANSEPFICHFVCARPNRERVYFE